jgi:hypothetical protein
MFNLVLSYVVWSSFILQQWMAPFASSDLVICNSTVHTHVYHDSPTVSNNGGRKVAISLFIDHPFIAQHKCG